MEMSNIVMSVLKIIYYFCVCLLDFLCICVSQFCCSTLIINEDGPDERSGGIIYVGLGQNGRLFTLKKVYIGLFYIFHLIVCKKMLFCVRSKLNSTNLHLILRIV